MNRFRHILAGLALAVSVGLPGAHAADPAPCTSPPRVCILEAIAGLDPADRTLWTQAGKPRVGAVEAATGTDITAAERDAAWAEYPEWQARRAASAAAVRALAEVTAERDRLASHAGALEAQIAAFRVTVERAEQDATKYRRAALVAERRAATARDKARALAGGDPVCAAERAVVAADDSVFARGLRRKALALLDCLAIGER